MIRPPAPVRRRLLGCVCSLGALLSASACIGPAAEGAPHAPLTTASSAAATVRGTATATPAALTEAQARDALITDTDLGAPWVPTRGAATWRDGLLKAKASSGECQRFLDALYADELLGAPGRAVTGLDDADTEAQLRYQVSGSSATEVDRALAWLRTMPQTCGRFTATTVHDTVLDVQVSDAPLPEAGDVRQGLHVTLTDWSAEGGEPLVLTLDVAAVRVGMDAFTFTNGGMGDVRNDATQAAVQLGVQRLTAVRKQERAQV